MGNRVFLTESQFNMLMEHELIMESIFEVESLDEFKKELKRYARNLILAGVSITIVYNIISNACDKMGVPNEDANEIKTEVVADEKEAQEEGDWKLVHKNVIGTVYNAVPSQCNDQCNVTANNFRINMYNPLPHRIIAMERTFMQKLGLTYGDVVKIEGAGKLDGVWQIQDTMNKKFENMPKIDFLVPEARKGGQWDNLKLYILKDPSKTKSYLKDMAPQISRKESARQLAQKQADWKKKKEQKEKTNKENKNNKKKK